MDHIAATGQTGPRQAPAGRRPAHTAAVGGRARQHPVQVRASFRRLARPSALRSALPINDAS